jgi:molybdenum cofactor cytidylyltransferase
MNPVFGAVVLAAGSARRFGGGKLIALWRGHPLVVCAAASALAAADGGPVVVVLGEGAPAVRETLSDPRLTFVVAAEHQLGLAHSLRAGLEALPSDLAGVFVFLGDMPAIPDSVGPLLRAALAVGALAAAPQCDGRRGHPVLFSSALAPQLSVLSGDQGAGRLLDDLGADVALISTQDRGVLFDVDCPADLAAGPAT